MKSHHEKKGDWFGVLFVISLPNAVLSRAIEAQLIALAQESGVVGLTNKASENHYAETELAEIPPAIAKITGALEMLLGNDIFTSVDSDEPEVLTTKPEHLPKLARVYRGSAETPRDRGPGDPASATHAYVVPASLKSWGSFEGDEPNKAFRVLAGSSWRPAVPVGGPSTVASQLYQVSIQQGLIEAGVLDPETKTFNVAHVFENWTRAARCVSGIGTYSGSYHWQRLAS